MAPFSACIECRRNKVKCQRDVGARACSRCAQLSVSCDVVPRKLGRKLGSKNRRTLDASRDGVRRLDAGRHQAPTLSSLSPERAGVDFISPSTRSDPALGPELYHAGAEGSAAETTSPSLNMLSVLARVAHNTPSHPQRPPEDYGPATFDRNRFLANFQGRARTLSADPYMGMSLLEEGLHELEQPAENVPSQPGDDIVYASVDQPRLDVRPEYDPLLSGLVQEDEVVHLAAVFWSTVDPVLRLMDKEIHTMEYIRARSALLTTVVLLTAAQTLPVSAHTSALVARLESHVEWLITQIDKLCFQSLEICQGLLLFVAYLGGRKLNRAWPLTAKATSIAVELRLDVSPPPKWALAPSPHHSASPERLIRNVDRLMLLLVDWDRASAFVRSRRCMIPELPQSEPTRLMEWSTHPLATPHDVMTAACIVLLGMFVEFQLQIARLPVESPPFDFTSFLSNVDHALADWRDQWIPKLLPMDQALAEFDTNGFRFILLTTLYEYALVQRWPPPSTRPWRDACLEAGLEFAARAIPILSATHPDVKVSGLYSYRYYRIAYTAFCMLRIISTDPGDDDDDIFYLSITGALARRLIDLRLHANMSSITNVLGHRLMSTTRLLASARRNGVIQATGNGGQWAASAPTEASTSTMGSDKPEEESAPLDLPFELGGGPLATLFTGFSDGIFGMLDGSHFGFPLDVESVRNESTAASSVDGPN